MINPHDFLGNTVRDKLTGLVGIADSITEHKSGMIQVSIQPMGDGKTIPEAWTMDWHQMELIPDGPYLEVTPVTVVLDFSLGDQVQDAVSGYRGTAMKKITYLNGCVKCMIRPKYVPGKDSDFNDFTGDAEDVHKVPGPVARPASAPPRPSGGPRERSERA